MRNLRLPDGKGNRLDLLKRRAWFALAWERAWPSLAAALSVGGVFLAVSWLGLWLEAPRWTRVLGSLLFMAALVCCFAPLVLRGRISGRDLLARLDRDSGLGHRPASALEDRLANTAGDPTTDALWTLHQRKLKSASESFKVAAPSPRMAEWDRFALRAAALVALFAAAFVAGPEKYARVAAAFDWSASGASSNGARLDAWIDPPAYTGRPPLVLTEAGAADQNHDRKVSAPFGSAVIVRSTGLSGLSLSTEGRLEAPKPPPPPPDKTAGPGSTASGAQNNDDPAAERKWVLNGDGKLILRRYGAKLAEFDIASIPDKPPRIALLGQPKLNFRGTLTLDYQLDDDYGVVGAEARFSDPVVNGERAHGRPLVAPPKVPLALPPGAQGVGKGRTTADLADSPWAGARVVMTLAARDEAGNEGLSEPLAMQLPQRVFTKPLARALVEQRRNLVLAPDERSRVAIAMDALMIAPERFGVSSSVYLGLTAISYRLASSRTDADLLSVADLMWEMALRVEDGDASQAERDLRASQQKLRDALQRGASPDEIRKLTEELRANLDKFLQALTQQQRKTNRPQAKLDSRTPVITQRDLQAMLNQMENMARSGDMADAQQMLDQLQNLLENLQTAQQGENSTTQRMSREMSELDQMTRDQQQLRDQTFQDSQRSDQDSQRSDQGAPAEGQPPSQKDGASQQLLRQQQALRQKLNALEKRLKQLGMDARNLNEAEQAMRDAESGLNQSNQAGDDQAVEAQGQALEALRRGAQSLAQQMQQNGQGQMAGPGGFGMGQPHPGPEDNTDPLGRLQPGVSPPGGRLPIGPGATQRAQQVLEELRRRLGNAGRPQQELDYIERLLHPH